MWNESYDNKPALYLVPTPIGNLKDITLRAIDVLNSVDYIFSEDTRTTQILLNSYNIKKKLFSLHEHNEDNIKEKVLEFINDGKNIALVTDRGTPIISDPGYKTVKYLTDNGKKVIALPGPCAFVSALIVSGIAPQPFTFYGFLNSKETKKNEELELLKNKKETIIFYEAPHRINKTLQDIYNIFGNRKISISREISKKYESIYYGDIKGILDSNYQIIGEIVLVVEGNNDVKISNIENSIKNVDEYIKLGVKKADAIKLVAKQDNISKNELYEIYHKENKE